MVEILVVVGIIALLAAIAIPNLLRARITANESAARATLKTVSTALETYALANGAYPLATNTLIGQTPPYLSVDYFTGEHSGYTFAATLALYSYSIVASPANASQGLHSYTVETGAVITENP